jgi:hypothetical protein
MSKDLRIGRCVFTGLLPDLTEQRHADKIAGAHQAERVQLRRAYAAGLLPG